MSPNFNMAAVGLYSLKLYRKNSFEIGKDGMRVEYTLDKGDNWFPLATTTSAGWYDFANTATNTAFPINQAYFNNTQNSYLLCQFDISSLAGNNNVAFRLRFKSDDATTEAGIAIDDFEIVGALNSPLPVELISFTATPVSNKEVLSKWTTGSENGNSYFTIERSKDAVHFETAGTLPGSGTTSTITSYAFTDANPHIGISYYRLKQTDYNGAFSYSATTAVKIISEQNIIVFPTITTDYVSVYGDVKLESAAITLINVEGKIMKVEAGKLSDIEFQLNLSSLSSGIYFINVSSYGHSKNFKVIKK